MKIIVTDKSGMKHEIVKVTVNRDRSFPFDVWCKCGCSRNGKTLDEALISLSYVDGVGANIRKKCFEEE